MAYNKLPMDTLFADGSSRQPACLILVSVDGLAAGDYTILRDLPAFRRLLDAGACVRRVKGVYPTQTYPQHASLVTGTYPDTHGIAANTRLKPGEGPDWFWYRRDLRVSTLYDAATEAGLRVGTLFWPSAGGAAHARVLPEILPARPGEHLMTLVMKAGTPGFVLHMLLRYGYLLRGLRRRYLDNFTCACASHLIRRGKIDLLLLHLFDLDATRHRLGTRSPEAARVLREHDRRLEKILAAVQRSGRAGQTAVVVTGDHAHRDVHTRIHINTALREAGLQSYDAAGRLGTWEAWALSCDGSAQIILRQRDDPGMRRRVYSLLVQMQQDPGNGIAAVLGREQLAALRVGDTVDFAVEARPGFFFSSRPGPALLAEACPRYRAAHGYLPAADEYSALFLAAGSGFRRGAELYDAGIVDLGTTLAHLLGLTLPAAEGRVLQELLNAGGV
jgi:predicted AlkP superfamily pyrophosphatase or phosphodiesterase